MLKISESNMYRILEVSLRFLLKLGKSSEILALTELNLYTATWQLRLYTVLDTDFLKI